MRRFCLRFVAAWAAERQRQQNNFEWRFWKEYWNGLVPVKMLLKVYTAPAFQQNDSTDVTVSNVSVFGNLFTSNDQTVSLLTKLKKTNLFERLVGVRILFRVQICSTVFHWRFENWYIADVMHDVRLAVRRKYKGKWKWQGMVNGGQQWIHKRGQQQGRTVSDRHNMRYSLGSKFREYGYSSFFVVVLRTLRVSNRVQSYRMERTGIYGRLGKNK